jgi:hypothetical protein
VGNLECIGGGGGGDVEGVGGEGEAGEGVGGEGEGGEGEGGEGEGGEGEGGVGEGGEGEGEGGEGEGVEGEGGEGGGGGDVAPMVMLKEDPPSPSRKASGGSSPRSLLVGDWLGVLVPLLLARRVARLLARVAVRAALARFVGRGLALSTRAKRVVVSGTGGGGGDGGGGTGSGGGTGDEAASAVATIAATPVAGVAWGEHLSPASILSTLRLALLARSRLLLPELARAAVATSAPATAVRNQRETSSPPLPSVFSTSFAGTLSSLHRTHALYCEKAHGGGRGVEPVLVLLWAGRVGVLLQVGTPLATSAQVGAGGGDACCCFVPSLPLLPPTRWFGGGGEGVVWRAPAQVLSRPMYTAH